MTFNRLLSCTLAAGLFALPGLAQEVRGQITVDAPTLSETKSGQADWYRQYAQSHQTNDRSAWQAEPDDNFSVVIGGDHRWQLSFDKLSRPAVSPLPREQVQAGAIFRITPRFSVGGEVSVGADELNATLQGKKSWEKDDVETGIRVKSAFKF